MLLRSKHIFRLKKRFIFKLRIYKVLNKIKKTLFIIILAFFFLFIYKRLFLIFIVYCLIGFKGPLNKLKLLIIYII